MDLVHVGAFELYPSERKLCSGGKQLDLGARAFDLLLVLVESPGKLVTKATLLERVWPRLVVDENNLPAQVAALRRVLGPGAIRTVPGFGYRLELEVRSGDASSAGAPSEHPGAAPLQPLPKRSWPHRLAPMVGRDSELREVEDALASSCLVSIVGIAGVGKTRLAQEVMARWAGKSGAASWVSLRTVEVVEHVPSAISVALGLSLPDDGDDFASLGLALRDLRVLLVLDCAEHLGESLGAHLAELLADTQGVHVLLTSQAPLGVAGEVVYRLAALAAPDPGISQEMAAQYASVALFAERARAADRGFELTPANVALVAEVCRRLDGIPLALELAAARVPALGLASLLQRLDDRFRLLRAANRPSDARHGALHTAFDWSYDLLSEPEKRVFDRLGAFSGSFSLDSAASYAADADLDSAEVVDLIGRLVDRSLVSVLAVDPPRYTLLESARDYAREKLLARGTLHAARQRLAATLLDLLDRAYQEYWSLDEALWLHRYEHDLANVRVSIDWTMQHDPDLAVALFGSAWPLFVESDLHGEGRARYSQVLALLHDGLPRARIGRFWESIAAYDSARQCDRARYAAELAAQMHASTSDARSHYFALMQLAANWRVDTEAARAAFDAARALEDPAWPARLLAHGALTEGTLLTSAGEFVAARAAYQRAMRLALTLSERQALAATVSIVELDIACGDPQAALQLGRPLALSLRHLGRRETQFELLTMTFVALLLTGELAEARATGAELLELALRLDRSKLYTVLDAMAYLAGAEQRYEAAARICACADAAHAAQGQLRRRPVQERMRNSVTQALDEHLGERWHERVDSARLRLDEPGACALALGLTPE
ncbi:MAG: winged helix-turn-helix domain-containing protein [Proteobacteria bacterium]|nr:winged helix-turn-helix domain-containing protein [Pseudomonadota bacterium]